MNNLQFQSGAIDATDCIGNAWTQVTAKFGLYLGMGLVTFLLISCIPLANYIVYGPVMAGFYYVALKDMRGEPVEFGELFRGFDKFVTLMVVGLIQLIPTIILQILQTAGDVTRIFMAGAGSRRGDFYQTSNFPDLGLSQGVIFALIGVFLVIWLFSIIWYLAFMFAVPIAMENDIGAIEALKLSVRAAFSNLGGLIVLLILSILVGLLGLAALCVGFFVAMPVVWVANAFAYRQVFPWMEQRMNFNPPPPTAYGDLNSGLQG
ncbi:MAG: hypothetical protein JNL64_15435 [Blastocatellia bacterium]|nr:hypothetical protein [Blastocatellia bacterium]